MLIADYDVRGTSGYFSPSYRTIAQVNDGIAGAVIMLEVIESIHKKYDETKFTYKALVKRLSYLLKYKFLFEILRR